MPLPAGRRRDRGPALRPGPRRAADDAGDRGHLSRAPDRVERALAEALGDEFDPDTYEFVNHNLKKRDVNEIVSKLVEDYGAPVIAQALDAFKDLGFHFATQAGITISKNDVISPPNKEEILERYEKEAQEIQGSYEEGYITAEERKESVTER